MEALKLKEREANRKRNARLYLIRKEEKNLQARLDTLKKKRIELREAEYNAREAFEVVPLSEYKHVNSIGH